jgi:methionyl-tRNA synthetase
MSTDSTFKRTLVTSALPYANGHIHLGHIAGAYLPADAFVRYKRLTGEPVLYIGGSDEHGVPVTLTALQEDVSPQDVIDRYHNANAEAFAQLGISYDMYGRTSWPLHVDTTQAFFAKLDGGGHIEQKPMDVWYSEQSNRYLPDRYVKGTCPECAYEDATGDECESCGAQYSPDELLKPRVNIPGDISTPVLRESHHWFLRLQDFQEKLLAWLDTHPEWRSNVKGIAYGWAKDLRSRCITRDTDWGIPLPMDSAESVGKRIYVWFDAPIGYVTNTRQWGIDAGKGEAAWEQWWKETDTRLLHFIGKDNVPFHAVIFPAMLMGQEGYVLPENVVGNEYLNIFNRETGKEEKGSKSKGNMISVRWFASKFSRDAIRYYLCANMPESKDAAFDWDEFVNRYNGELCDVVGNFVHRSLTMTVKNFDSQVPTPGKLDEDDQQLLDAIPAQLDAIAEAFESYRFRLALERFIDLGRKSNQYFDTKEPWVTRKTDLERTSTTLYVCCQVVRALCTAMAPFAPDGAAQLAGILGVALPEGGPDGGENGWKAATEGLPAGAPLQKPTVLFPKIDADTIADLAAEHANGATS